MSSQIEGGGIKRLLADYKQYNYKKVSLGLVLLLLLGLASLYALRAGSVEIEIREIFSLIFRGGEVKNQSIIFNIRLPRIVSAILSGAGLAVSGTIMQSILKNPLGSPYTLGVSQAASFGAALSIVLRGRFGLFPYATTIIAFSSSLLAVIMIVFLIKYKSTAPETIILAGVALGSLFTAGITSLQYFATETEVAEIVFWTFGDLGRTVWEEIAVIALVLVVLLVYFLVNSWNYQALSAGEETAKSLGVKVERLRLLAMVGASLLTAVIVSFVGIIGFVGLTAPHIIKKIIGRGERFVIPLSALAGSLLLLVADTAARTVISPTVLPVGVLTSFLGGPLFIYLIVRMGE